MVEAWMLRALIPLALIASSAALARTLPPKALEEVDLAIEAGRLDQARMMISEQVRAGIPEESLNKVLANLAFASGKNEEALARYQRVLQRSADDRVACERAGIAALRLNRVTEARSLLLCATAEGSASWRAWNARGVLADLEQDWNEAARSYATALRFDERNAMILNNIGFSYLLQGDWNGAVQYFDRAHKLDPSVERIRNNRELAIAALDDDLPGRLPNESPSAWAVRLNDAAFASRILGDRTRAIAGFTRALEANGSWYARAANNLDEIGSK